MVDEECPYCNAKDISPYDANDVTFLVVKQERGYVVLRSPDTAEHHPDYVEIREFATRDLAETYVIEMEDQQ
jgi:hypothetical protein